MSRLSTVLSGAFLLAGTELPAHAALQIVGKPRVSFFAEGSPGALDIEGKSNALTMIDDGTLVTCTVDMTTLDTGIELRDHHMKDEYLHVGTYPDSSLAFDRGDLQLPAAQGDSVHGSLSARFTAHGVTLPTTVSYTIKLGKKGYAVDATFVYDASKHGIAIPSYLGITVDPAQNARVRFDMVDQ